MVSKLTRDFVLNKARKPGPGNLIFYWCLLNYNHQNKNKIHSIGVFLFGVWHSIKNQLFTKKPVN
jgi:hypothetical protein